MSNDSGHFYLIAIVKEYLLGAHRMWPGLKYLGQSHVGLSY